MGTNAVAARQVLGVPGSVALLLGALLVVTGPTVIGPLLRHIRPTGRVGPVAKWEGIVIDPIGATLAVLVYEGLDAIRQAEFGSATLECCRAWGPRFWSAGSSGRRVPGSWCGACGDFDPGLPAESGDADARRGALTGRTRCITKPDCWR